MRFTLGKMEKLKSKKAIELLFEKGNRIKSFPIQLVYLRNSKEREIMLRSGFSVPKRSIKKAVERNEIKRLMREVFRNQKISFSENLKRPHDFMFVYLSKEKESYATLEKAMEKLNKKFLIKIAEDET